MPFILEGLYILYSAVSIDRFQLTIEEVGHLINVEFLFIDTATVKVSRVRS